MISWKCLLNCVSTLGFCIFPKEGSNINFLQKYSVAYPSNQFLFYKCPLQNLNSSILCAELHKSIGNVFLFIQMPQCKHQLISGYKFQLLSSMEISSIVITASCCISF